MGHVEARARVFFAALAVLALTAFSGCGGGGGGGGEPPPPEATGTILLNVVLSEPAGITDYSGILVSVSGASSTTTATTGTDGKLSFAGLKITDTKNGTVYTITASKTDYSSSTLSVVLVKNGDQQSGSMSLQYAASKLVTQAWSSFSSGSYASALSDFTNAVSRAVTAQEVSDSNTGLAWTYYLGYASSDSTKYKSALDSFTTALNANASNLDAKVGQSFVLVDNAGNNSGSTFLGDLNTAIGNGEQVLTSNSTYSFANATQFNYVDVRAMLAYAYAQKYLSTGSAGDKSSACTNAALVPTTASEYATASAAINLVGGCP